MHLTLVAGDPESMPDGETVVEIPDRMIPFFK